SLNLMSLGGLAVAIGLVIDDAIVVVEAIGRRTEEGIAPDEAAAQGIRSLFGALVGTTLTTVVVFLPLAWLEGFVGRFFAALAAPLPAAVILSLLVALLVVPLAGAAWMRPRRAATQRRYADIYGRLIAPMLHRPWMGLVLSLVLIALGVVSVRFVPTGFLP